MLLVVVPAAWGAVDGEGCTLLLAATAGETLVLEDLGLTNASGRCAQGLSGRLDARGVDFTDCGAPDLDGGAVALRTVDATLDGCRFARGAGATGGAVRVQGGTLTLSSTTFTGNTATSGGGAVRVHRVADGARFADVTFDDNTAGSGSGGAIEARLGSVVRVERGAFRRNEAGSAGGGFAVDAGSLTLRDTASSDNTSGGTGGAVDAAGETPVSLVGASSCRDVAVEDGGAVRISGGRPTLRNAVFQHEAAGRVGGAIAAVDAQVSAGWLTLVEGHAAAGAALWVSGGSLDLHSSLLAWSNDGPALSIGTPATLTGGWNGWWANSHGDAPDASRADIGAWGGPDARWTDADGDGLAWPGDCDDTDPTVTDDCGEAEDTAPPDPGDDPDPVDTGGGAILNPGLPRGPQGTCGCGAASAAWLLAVLSLPLRRRASRRGSGSTPSHPTRSGPAARPPGAGRSARPSR